MSKLIRRFWNEDDGQDIAEYAVMLAVILVLVVGTIRLIGSNADAGGRRTRTTRDDTSRRPNVSPLHRSGWPGG